MAQATCNGITLEYETFGDAADPAVLLIAGLGFQLIDWQTSFCERIAAAGHYVVRFDNRDIGLSEKLETLGTPDLPAILKVIVAGGTPKVPYFLKDMAADTVGLMDALGIARAHIVGMSMGGMIAQQMAVFYPNRLISLTSMMSSSSNRFLPPPSAAANTVLMNAPSSQDLDDVIAFGLEVNDVIGSPGFRWDRVALMRHIRSCVERCYCPTGYLRQYTAVQASRLKEGALAGVMAPTLVIHGKDDMLIPWQAGSETAELIKDARFELVPGMGHDLSPALSDHLAGIILPHLEASRP
ncbi:MAG: alpha/beta hydrolase [Alphaproteobacteria bacterium]|nr:MAG: alpha/beta hydrolase [Alphaproteobacteria bacterium]